MAVSLLAKAKLRSGQFKPIFREKFAVNIWAWWKDARSQIDADGSLKMVLDALQEGGLFSSDKFALPRWINYAFDGRKPRMLLEIICPPPDPLSVPITLMNPMSDTGESLEDFTVVRRMRRKS